MCRCSAGAARRRRVPDGAGRRRTGFGRTTIVELPFTREATCVAKVLEFAMAASEMLAVRVERRVESG